MLVGSGSETQAMAFVDVGWRMEEEGVSSSGHPVSGDSSVGRAEDCRCVVCADILRSVVQIRLAGVHSVLALPKVTTNTSLWHVVEWRGGVRGEGVCWLVGWLVS